MCLAISRHRKARKLLCASEVQSKRLIDINARVVANSLPPMAIFYGMQGHDTASFWHCFRYSLGETPKAFLKLLLK